MRGFCLVNREVDCCGKHTRQHLASHFTADGRLVPGEVTDLLPNITTQWVQLSNGMTVTPGHLFARPGGGFMTIADVLRLDGQILDVCDQRSSQTVTGPWVQVAGVTVTLCRAGYRLRMALIRGLIHAGKGPTPATGTKHQCGLAGFGGSLVWLRGCFAISWL